MTGFGDEHGVRGWWLFLGCLAFRCLNGWAVWTYFNPDEFWQSLEIAHRLVFGYGYVTWEWEKGIRGYTHPLIFASLYWILAKLGWDTTTALWLGPRFLQAVFAAMGDVYLFRLTQKLFSPRAAYWALFCQLSNWFTFFTITRTFSNCMEAPLTTAALFYWPLSSIAGKALTPQSRRERQLALLLAGVACAVRPTSAIVWIYVGAWHTILTHDRLRFLALNVAPIGALCLGLSTAVDRLLYGRWLLVPLEFLRFNFLSSGADIYGTHPWHWYFTQGFPAITTTLLPFSVIGAVRSKRWAAAGLVLWTLALYSCLGHKEFRFVLPVLPLALAFAGHALATLEAHEPHHKKPIRIDKLPPTPSPVPGQSSTDSLRRRGRGFVDQTPTSNTQFHSVEGPEARTISGGNSKVGRGRTWGLALFIVLTQVPMALYFSLLHQGGSVAVMSFLSEEATRGNATGILFLMPCHSTPFYSHVHVPIPMRTLDCSPSDVAADESETAAFLRDPASFLATQHPLSWDFMNRDCARRSSECNPQGGAPMRIADMASPDRPTPLSPGPSHVVLFDAEERKVSNILGLKGYKQARRFFHAHVPVDRDLQGEVVVYVWQGVSGKGDNTE